MSHILGIIPARGGSKRVPGKNLRELHGKPLIAWTIETLIASEVFTRIIVSTDSPEIAEVAVNYGAEVPALRPEYLAQDDSLQADLMQYMLVTYGEGYDAISHFNPTTPFRTVADVQEARRIFENPEVQAVVSVVKVAHPIEWAQELTDTGKFIFSAGFEPRSQSQDMKSRYMINGAIYMAKVPYFLDHLWYGPASYAYIMPEDRSLDMDTEFDFRFADFLLSR